MQEEVDADGVQVAPQRYAINIVRQLLDCLNIYSIRKKNGDDSTQLGLSARADDRENVVIVIGFAVAARYANTVMVTAADAASAAATGLSATVLLLLLLSLLFFAVVLVVG